MGYGRKKDPIINREYNDKNFPVRQRQPVSGEVVPAGVNILAEGTPRVGDPQRDRILQHINWCESLGYIDPGEAENRRAHVLAATHINQLSILHRDLPPLTMNRAGRVPAQRSGFFQNFYRNNHWMYTGAAMLIAFASLTFAPTIVIANHGWQHWPALAVLASVVSGITGVAGFILTCFLIDDWDSSVKQGVK